MRWKHIFETGKD